MVMQSVIILLASSLLIIACVRHIRGLIRTFRPLPIVGHLPWFGFLSRQALLEWFMEIAEYNDGQTWPLQVPLLGTGWVTEDPACVKHILSTRHNAFAKGPFSTSRMHELFGDGIVLVSGSKWKSQRLAGHQAFTRPANLQRFAEVTLPSHIGTLLGSLDKAAEKRETVIDLQEVALEYAMAVFGELAYDSDFGRISAQFTGPFTRASVVTDSRFINPLYWVAEWVLPYGRRFRRDVREVKMFGRELVNEMRVKILAEEEGRDEKEPVEEAGEGDGKGTLLRELLKTHNLPSDEPFLADAALNFLTAGRDTTAQALTWVIYEILLHPKMTATILTEIADLPYGATSHADLTSHTGPLAFVNAIISESLRLHPPVPFELLQNVSDEAIKFPDQAGTVVKPGEKVIWCPYVMGRSKRIWGPDSLEFNPSRWLDHPIEILKSSSSPLPSLKHPTLKTAYENPVFHGGPRNCLGKPLARAELAFCVVEIWRRYVVQPAWDVKVERRMGEGLLAPMKGGLPIKVRRRSAFDVESRKSRK